MLVLTICLLRFYFKTGPHVYNLNFTNNILDRYLISIFYVFKGIIWFLIHILNFKEHYIKFLNTLCQINQPSVCVCLLFKNMFFFFLKCNSQWRNWLECFVKKRKKHINPLTSFLF